MPGVLCFLKEVPVRGETLRIVTFMYLYLGYLENEFILHSLPVVNENLLLSVTHYSLYLACK